MTHKERLLTAINHEEPDRVPICAWYTPEAERTMLRHLGVDSDRTETYKAAGGPLPVLMEHDFLISWIGPCTSYYADPSEEYTDEWGIRWRWIKNPVGSYTEMVRHPLADLTDPSKYSLPDFSREDRYAGLRHLVAEYGTEYGIMGGAACTLFELAWYLMGIERVLMALVCEKDFMNVFLDDLVRWVDVAGSRMVELGVDIIWIGDDFGTQDRMLIAPELFREFFKPRYEKLFSKWKRINPNVKTAFHSDGNIYPIIPDLVEIGLDILNPVQPKSMDPAKLKKDFGKHLTFWGTVDIQEVLPFGTTTDVANEVKLRLQTVGQGGGLIIAPAHNIQPDVPLDNILAFYETAKTFGRYPISAA
ncbi:MAG: uroporphyrinogen decarboxylase family protein [Acidobacteriota bacterium]